MDGTLIDSDEVIHKTWCELAELYKPKGFTFKREETCKFSGPPLRESLAKVFPEYDLDFIHKEYKERTKKYYDQYLAFFENEDEVLHKFYDEGMILAVDTNKLRSATINCLNKGKIIDLFKVVIGADDVNELKPSPEGVNKILKECSASRDKTLFIGDTDFDLLTAKNAEIKSVLMTMKHHDVKNIEMADYIVNNFDELYSLIKNLNS